MKVGDMVLYCDPACAQVEPVLIVELIHDGAPGVNTIGAVVMNELGTHWVQLDNLVAMDEAGEALDELAQGTGGWERQF